MQQGHGRVHNLTALPAACKHAHIPDTYTYNHRPLRRYSYLSFSLILILYVYAFPQTTLNRTKKIYNAPPPQFKHYVHSKLHSFLPVVQTFTGRTRRATSTESNQTNFLHVLNVRRKFQPNSFFP